MVTDKDIETFTNSQMDVLSFFAVIFRRRKKRTCCFPCQNPIHQTSCGRPKKKRQVFGSIKGTSMPVIESGGCKEKYII